MVSIKASALNFVVSSGFTIYLVENDYKVSVDMILNSSNYIFKTNLIANIANTLLIDSSSGSCHFISHFGNEAAHSLAKCSIFYNDSLFYN